MSATDHEKAIEFGKALYRRVRLSFQTADRTSTRLFRRFRASSARKLKRPSNACLPPPPWARSTHFNVPGAAID